MLNTNWALTLGRIFFAVPFFMFGVAHFRMAEEMATIVPNYLPYGIYWVYFTGLVLLLAAIAIVAKMWMQWACYGLAIFLAFVICMVHLPSMLAGSDMGLTALLKDLGLLGGALVLSTWRN